MAYTTLKQEAQLPQRNSASAAHVYLGCLTDRAMHRTPQNRRGCTETTNLSKLSPPSHFGRLFQTALLNFAMSFGNRKTFPFTLKWQ